uniref:Uncharacterized protein n=1 Tax=Globisporangium ultimum (strain ATCC 200006 / CBS 805.95 / DAOM BR144) TaxID=431595 RepID=K3WVK6_GLOUD
ANAQATNAKLSGYASRDEAVKLHQLSIGRLLQTVSADRDDEAARELCESWRLERVELHANVAFQASRDALKRYGSKRARRDDLTSSAAVDGSAGKQVLYASHNVWLIGFLRFPNEASTGISGLHLCDANAHVLALLLNPRPEYVGQLVLIKKWALE